MDHLVGKGLVRSWSHFSDEAFQPSGKFLERSRYVRERALCSFLAASKLPRIFVGREESSRPLTSQEGQLGVWICI